MGAPPGTQDDQEHAGAGATLTSTLQDISESLRKITQPSWDINTSSSARDAGGGGGSRLFQGWLESRARETEHFAGVLEDRVHDVVEGYRKLNELASQGPKLFREAVGGAAHHHEFSTSRFDETDIEGDHFADIARSYDASYSDLLQLHEERLALSRSMAMNDETTHLYHSSSSATGRRSFDSLTRSRPNRSSSTHTVTATKSDPSLIDRPLPIPRFPTAYLHSERPTRQIFWKAPSANVESTQNSRVSMEVKNMVKVQQGYVLPAEVQAALLLMPRPDAASLRASYDLGKQTRPPPVVDNIHSPPRKVPQWKAKKKQERPSEPSVIKQTNASNLLRKKLKELEEREDLSAASLVAIEELLNSQTERTKELEDAIRALMDRINDEEAKRQQMQRPPPVTVMDPGPEEESSPPIYRVLPVHQKTKATEKIDTGSSMMEIVLGGVGRLEVGEGVNADHGLMHTHEEEPENEMEEDDTEGGPKKVVLRGEGQASMEGGMNGNWEEKYGSLRRRHWPLDLGLDDVVRRLIDAVLDSVPYNSGDEKEETTPPQQQEVVVPAQHYERDGEPERRAMRRREQEAIAREAREAAEALRKEREALEEARRRATADNDAERAAHAQVLASMVGDLMARLTAMESRQVPSIPVPERRPTPPPPQPIIKPTPPSPKVTRAIQVGRPPVPPPSLPALPPSLDETEEDECEDSDYEETPVEERSYDERRYDGVWPWPSFSDDSTSLSSTSPLPSAARHSKHQRILHTEETEEVLSVASSFSEGQIFPEGPDEMSEGQLTRRYKVPSSQPHIRRVKKVTDHVFTSKKDEVEGWHSGSLVSSLDLSSSDDDLMADDQESLEGAHRKADGLAEKIRSQKADAAARLRLLRWRRTGDS